MANLREQGQQALAQWFTNHLASDAAPLRTGSRLFGRPGMALGSSSSLGSLVETLVDLMWRSMTSSSVQVSQMTIWAVVADPRINGIRK